ncbi:hypothetical protein [Leucobacter manosquensis]|uniref:Uncharacterized protein n=1 Tax=Leucobacter manosquensis TaxID=2810611 RepID=A0ABS5M2N7_9MICO|nr:hypothetical protein [Leucobacter manosquensis]MBS3180976.1 hypothetical protein [Leucobacter manosquensis]
MGVERVFCGLAFGNNLQDKLDKVGIPIADDVFDNLLSGDGRMVTWKGRKAHLLGAVA